MERLSVMLDSLINYALGVAALVYLIAFLFNLFVPKTIDSGEPGNVAVAVAVDLGLIFLFGLQHSVMARPRFKGRQAT